MTLIVTESAKAGYTATGGADQLKKRGPDLFDWQHAKSPVKLPSTFTRRVYRPMSGEDLYLTVEDLRVYGRATISFWNEFADALERASTT